MKATVGKDVAIYLQVGCSSWRRTNSVKALKAGEMNKPQRNATQVYNLAEIISFLLLINTDHGQKQSKFVYTGLQHTV